MNQQPSTSRSTYADAFVLASAATAQVVQVASASVHELQVSVSEPVSASAVDSMPSFLVSAATTNVEVVQATSATTANELVGVPGDSPLRRSMILLLYPDWKKIAMNYLLRLMPSRSWNKITLLHFSFMPNAACPECDHHWQNFYLPVDEI